MDTKNCDSKTDLNNQHFQQFAAINRIARITLQDLSIQPMLQCIVDALHDEFHWEFIACVSFDKQAKEFVCEALCNTIRTDIKVGYRRALGSGVVGSCALSANH